MTRLFSCLALLALTACGVDGKPVAPGATVSGDVTVGVVMKP